MLSQTLSTSTALCSALALLLAGAPGCTRQAALSRGPAAHPFGCSEAAPTPRSRALGLFVPGLASAGRKAKVAQARARLDAYFAKKLGDIRATGMAVGLVVDGELVYAAGFGVRDVESKVAVDADTVFRIASLTKSFTAMAIMKLRDEGRLELDVPAARYLPELSAVHLPTGDAPAITTRMLLTHSSGLAWDDLWGAETFGIDDAQLDRLIRSGLSFSYAPGTGYAYSNLGYALLGRIVERVSGRPFRADVNAEILAPLGMTATVWEASDAPPSRLAVGYQLRPDQQFIAEPRPPSGVFAPGGGLYTSLRDYARYAAFNLAAYPARDGAEAGPVRRSTVREMHQGQRITRRGDFDAPIARRTDDGISLFAASYGFGWHNVTSCNENGRVQHFGGEPGYFSNVTLLPRDGVALVVLATTAPVGSVFAGAAEILREEGIVSSSLADSPAPELVRSAAVVDGLVEHWDAAIVERSFDQPSLHYSWTAHLRDDLAALAPAHGHCHRDGNLISYGGLHGTWRLACERGALQLEASLTPAVPPLIQTLEWREELPAPPRLQETAARLTRAIARWQPTDAASLFAPSVDLARVKKAFGRLAFEYGACTVEAGSLQTEYGALTDSRTRAVFPLGCAEAPLILSFIVDDASGLVSEVDGHPPRSPDATCWQ